MKCIFVCLALLTLGWGAPRMAAADCCEQCGCQCECCKTCKLVCGTKKVPKIKYECECEDICIPGPSCLLGYKCVPNDDCECGGHTHREPIWQPQCGRVITRHKPKKVETMKEVPTYKCEVVNTCPKCTAKIKAENEQLAEAFRKQQTEESQTAVARSKPTRSPQLDQVTAEPSETDEVKLASHENESPSFVNRLKRSFQPILGQ
ncbi:MAG TPA: hypothetical protein VMF30_08625 [Pirellulales bacterium]|nr:hypothetical protein [Pirellulales bacterium]